MAQDKAGPSAAGWVWAAWPLGWFVGTAAQVQQAWLFALWVYGVALGLALVLALVLALGGMAYRFGCRRWGGQGARSGGRMGVLLWLGVAIMLAWGSAGWRAGVRQAERIDAALEGVDVRITARVARMPQPMEQGWRFVAQVVRAELPDGTAVRLPPRVQLAWYRPWRDEAAPAWPPDLTAGQLWQWTVRLKAPHGSRNPHGFDYELWLWERGLGATGYVRTGAQVAAPQLLARGPGPAWGLGWRIERARQQVRDAALQRLAASGDVAAQRSAGVVAALVTGDQNAIARSDWEVFRRTGVAHLVSISGLHISMFAGLAAVLVGGVWRLLARIWPWRRGNPCLWLPAPSAAWLGGLALGAAYAVFSGWGVPAQRTVIMLAFLTWLRLSGRRWPWWMAWLWACALVLAVDPWACLQAGFWLSFVAVGVLFATAQRVQKRVSAQALGGWQRLGRYGLGLLQAQGAITLALAPLTLMLFGQASVVGLLANLLAIPWVTLVVTPAALGGALWSPLWQLAAGATGPLLIMLGELADWPWAQLVLPAAPWWLGLLAVLGALLLVQRGPWALRLAGVPLLLPVLMWQPVRPAPGDFDLLAVDVGQGSAVLVRTARHALLYDAGPRYGQHADAGERVLVPLLRALGVRLDRLVLSHADSDHTGGAPAVLQAQPGADVLASIEAQRKTDAWGPVEPCLAGQGWHWDGVSFEVLHPRPDDLQAARDSNAISCVIRVQAANGAAALLTGDIAAAQERALVARLGEGLRSDVLLAPHHGSRSSSSAVFLDAVAARMALVQSGYRNRFGHPARQVLQRYTARQMRVYASPECGAMHWDSRQPQQLHCEREGQRRYWHHAQPARAAAHDP